MIVYVESSAVLSWLLGEPKGERCRDILSQADRVVSSALTGLESARAISRAATKRRFTRTESLALLRLLQMAESRWDIHEVSAEVVARARDPFPVEPVRTLDSLHLATLSLFSEVLGNVTLLSLDDRIRDNARMLGTDIAP